MNKYLLYYADQDAYEGQDRPLAIVNTESRAEKIIKEIQSFGQSLADKMLYPFEEEIPDEEYSRRLDANHELLSNAKWPHNWEPSLYSDFERVWSNNDGPEKMVFVNNTVAYRELPVL